MYIMTISNPGHSGRGEGYIVKEFKNDLELQQALNTYSSFERIRVYKAEEMHIEKRIIVEPKSTRGLNDWEDR